MRGVDAARLHKTESQSEALANQSREVADVGGDELATVALYRRCLIFEVEDKVPILERLDPLRARHGVANCLGLARLVTGCSSKEWERSEDRRSKCKGFHGEQKFVERRGTKRGRRKPGL